MVLLSLTFHNSFNILLIFIWFFFIFLPSLFILKFGVYLSSHFSLYFPCFATIINIFVITYNAKSSAIAILVFTHNTCDQDWTCFLGHTGICLHICSVVCLELSHSKSRIAIRFQKFTEKIATFYMGIRGRYFSFNEDSYILVLLNTIN